MTDYYTTVCFELPVDIGFLNFGNRVLAGYEAVINDKYQLDDLDGEVRDAVENLVALGQYDLGFELVEYGSGKLNVEGDENVSLEGVALFASIMLAHANSMSVAEISYAATANKLVPDAFGGGTILVTKDQIEWMGNYRDIDEAVKDMRQALSLGTTAKIWHVHQLMGEIAAILVRLENGRVGDAKKMAGLIVGDTRWHGAAFEEYRAEYPEEFEQ